MLKTLFVFRYGISQLKSPQRQPTNPAVTSFSELQDRAKQFFHDTTNNSSENLTQLLQLIEDFCREGDKLIEEEKQVKKDLQEQVCIVLCNSIMSKSVCKYLNCSLNFVQIFLVVGKCCVKSITIIVFVPYSFVCVTFT